MRDAADHWLARHCAVVPGIAAGAVLLRQGKDLQAIAMWPAGAVLPGDAGLAAGAALARRAPLVQLLQDGGQLIAHPLHASGVLIGAAVVLRPAGAVQPEEQARLGAHAETFAAATLAPPAKREASAAEAATARSTACLELARQVLAQADAAAMATTLLAVVSHRLGADRACLGLREGRHTRIEAVSDGSRIDHRRAMQLDLAAAMDEAIDEGATLRWPLADGEPPRLVAAHASHGQRHGLSSLATLPIVRAGRAVGALSIEFSHGRSATADELGCIEDLLAIVMPAWLAQRERTRPWPRRFAARALALRAALGRQGAGRVKLAAAALLAAVGLLALRPAPDVVSAEARLEGRLQRALAAPADAYLKQIHVRPGDAVKAGSVLLDFEGEDLVLEQQRLRAELAGQDAALGDAMQRRDRARLAMASAKLDELRAQLAAVEQRLERSTLRAPFDAVVIAGDLQQQLGAPVKRGQTLLTLAPADGFRAIVEVEDGDIGAVRVGQHGSLVLTAEPHRAHAFTVARITPLAQSLQGRQVFEVEVALAHAAADAALLRPGMRGVARLAVGEAPRVAQWTREALAWMRLATWRWIG
ncbi:MAG TPA: HlyD family efflux transporter periplasmic adaptor subunit [Methylibium sp.]|uniref:efflux RND transporter periplasmic adaptor subunit n=1 Tax=Methylibium sp. TaxID=2067992 RepID=UPI002DB85C53|nr:HlyD family efflux transporter periplasmic adaptor subunit [Methylibium sp.]HEU4460761.1 HlyD family efflux transporter periplasmic adaptor subunit [Methylibium sp.]